jgi:L-fucose isomerase-like protein
MEARLQQLGYDTILMPADATPHGAVESAAEGEKYATWLATKRGQFDGVILCLPNFGDETGAVAALKDAGVPIWIHAYPDELDQMGFRKRRDAFCGKFSVMDVFCQYGVPFTTFPPHTVHPRSETFVAQAHEFACVCHVVKGMKNFNVGAIGARTTAFKTVRFDELTLQRHGITCETLDLEGEVSDLRQSRRLEGGGAAQGRTALRAMVRRRAPIQHVRWLVRPTANANLLPAFLASPVRAATTAPLRA